MSIVDEIQAIKNELSQLRAAIDCRGNMHGIYTSIGFLETKVDFYKANTGFDSIPTETKEALNRIYQMFLQLKTAIENDPAFEELINYS